jgi:phospholipid transport system transporter-binding protein
MSESCSVVFESETRVFNITGELSFSTVTDVMDETTLLFEKIAEIKIDLAGVTRSDSAGLALLIEWMRQAKKMKKTIQFKNLPAQMRAIADVTGLEEYLPVQ